MFKKADIPYNHSMNACKIIAIAGGSGSGKTFFAEALHKRLGTEKATLIYQDNYYKDQSHKFDHDGGAVNFDHPEAIDFNLLNKQLNKLKTNQTIQVPIYEFATHKRLEKTIEVAPTPVIIIDGILILTQEELRETFDISVYIETPEEIRFQRRMNRDIHERGRSKEGVIAQFEKQVKPMHNEFVEPSKEYADFINSGTDMEAFHKLLQKIEDLTISS